MSETDTLSVLLSSHIKMQQILQVLLKIQTTGSKEGRAPTQAWFSFQKRLAGLNFHCILE